MGSYSKRFIAFLIFLTVTVQGALLCCGFVVSAGAKNVVFTQNTVGKLNLSAVRSAELAMPALSVNKLFDKDAAPFDDEITGAYSIWLKDEFSDTVLSRETWLRQLMDKVGISEENHGSLAFSDQYLYACSDLFVSAYEHNMVYSQMQMEPYAQLTRSYLAKSVCGALGYKARSAECADLSTVESDMMTMVFYGYFAPDENDCVYPEKSVTQKEAQAVLDQVSRHLALSGKHILSFGDSIMYGMGNNGYGIADMVGDKYGMSVTDYSVSGASYEKLRDHEQIIDQINTAIRKREKADVILINGVTNDITTGKLGSALKGKNYKSLKANTFASTFEYAMGTLRDAYPNTPILYIRPHNMVSNSDKNERDFGDLAIAIAQKWGIATVDIYHDTDLNTEIAEMSKQYTFYRADKGVYDSVHPNRACYTKYYLPLVSDAISDLLT